MSIQTETARDVLLGAFEDIVVRMDEETLGASDMLTGVKTINRIMAMLSENGVDLGFTKLAKISDLITIPEGVIDSLVSLLALRLWPSYRTGEPSSQLVANARRGLAQMYKSGVEIGATEYPSTLPMGSGNEDSGGTYDIFYPDLDATILTENNGSVSLEDNTNTGTALPTPPTPPPEPIEVTVTRLVSSTPGFTYVIGTLGDYVISVTYNNTAWAIQRWKAGELGWTELATRLDFIHSGCVFDGRIFVGTDNAATGSAELLEWDGASGFTVRAAYPSADYIYLLSMYEHDGNLYVGTAQTLSYPLPILSPEAGNLLMWDGVSAFTVKATTTAYGLSKLITYNSKLYALCMFGDLYEYNGASTLTLKASVSDLIPDDPHTTQLAVYNNKLYTATRSYIVPQPGSYLLEWDGASAFTIAAPIYDATNDVLYTINLINGELFAGVGSTAAADKGIIVKFNDSLGVWELYIDLYAEGYQDVIPIYSLVDHLGHFYVVPFQGEVYEITYPT